MRGRRAVDSFFSQTHGSSNLVSSGRKGEPFSGSQCVGCPVPTGVPSSALPQCPKPPLRNRAGCPVWTTIRKSCSRRAEASLCVRLRTGWAGGSSLGPEKASIMPGIRTRTPAPGSTPSASLSPSLFLLPMSSVFQVKVKRANVPDLSAIISCSGSLLGINKTNLTQKKTKKQERERGPQNFWM